MTIDSVYSREIFPVNAARTYIFTFESQGSDTIFVTYLDAVAGRTPVPAGDYVLTFGGGAPTYDGGTVVINDPPPAGTVEVEIQRSTDIQQLVDYQPYTAFPAETHEFALDKLTLICQEINDILLQTVDLDGDYVTLSTAQTITGQKTFNTETRFRSSAIFYNLTAASPTFGVAFGAIAYGDFSNLGGLNEYLGIDSVYPDSDIVLTARDGAGGSVNLWLKGDSRELYWNGNLIADTNGVVGGGGNFVTVDTQQTITGLKTFASTIYLQNQTSGNQNAWLYSASFPGPVHSVFLDSHEINSNIYLQARDGVGTAQVLLCGADGVLYWLGVPIANSSGIIQPAGGFVDLVNDQSVAGVKTWEGNILIQNQNTPTKNALLWSSDFGPVHGVALDSVEINSNVYLQARDVTGVSQTLVAGADGILTWLGVPIADAGGVIGGAGGNFVTVDTTQTVTGSKTFSAAETIFNENIKIKQQVGNLAQSWSINVGTDLGGFDTPLMFMQPDVPGFFVVDAGGNGGIGQTHVTINSTGRVETKHSTVIGDTDGTLVTKDFSVNLEGDQTINGQKTFTDPTTYMDGLNANVIVANTQMNSTLTFMTAGYITQQNTGVSAICRKDYIDGQVATKVSDTRTISSGNGISGGGDLSADRTLSVANNVVQHSGGGRCYNSFGQVSSAGARLGGGTDWSVVRNGVGQYTLTFTVAADSVEDQALICMAGSFGADIFTALANNSTSFAIFCYTSDGVAQDNAFFFQRMYDANV